MSLLKEASELASQCFSIANKFKSLYGSYQGAMGTLESLSSECNTTATMIMSIHGILVNKPATLSRNSSVIESFRDSITQCSRAVEELNKELSKYGNVGGVSERARFTINENHLKELLQTIRNQRSVVHFVVSCLQTEALSTMQSQPLAEFDNLTLSEDNLNILGVIMKGDYARVNRLLLSGEDPNFRPYKCGPSCLHTATEKGRIPIMKLLIAHGADVNRIWETNGTPLAVAIQEKQSAAAIELLDAGADPNIPFTYGWTILSVAVMNGMSTCVRKLLECGVDPNQKGKSGSSALHMAICHTDGGVKMVEDLVYHGADPLDTSWDKDDNAHGQTLVHLAASVYEKRSFQALVNAASNLDMFDNNGWTPLHYALRLETNARDAINILLKAGADIDAHQPEKSTTPLLYVVGIPGQEALAEYLLQCGACPSAVDPASGTHVIHVAAHSGMKKVVKRLLERGVDVNVRSNQQWTPLRCAAQSNAIEMASFLLEHGADVDALDRVSDSSLCVAAMDSRVELVQLLLRHKADVNIRRVDGRNPLICAAQEGYTDVVRVLLSHGADVNYLTDDSYSSLYWATNNGHADVARLLLENGATLESRTPRGDTPLMHAITLKNAEIVEMILNRQPDIEATFQGKEPDDADNTALDIAVIQDCPEIVKLLLRHGTKVDRHRSDGLAPLHSAVLNERVEIVKILLEEGQSNVDITLPDGFTPLGLAIEKENLEIVRLLLGRRAQLDRLQKGYAALHLALAKGNRPIVELLLEHGADVNLQAKKGATPFDCASFSGSVPLMQLLMRKGADATAEGPTGETALNAAVFSGSIPAVTFLIALGLNVSKADEFGTTCLHLAAARGNLEMCNFLLSMGAEKNTVSRDMGNDGDEDCIEYTGLKGTAAEVARLRGHDDIAKAIEKY